MSTTKPMTTLTSLQLRNLENLAFRAVRVMTTSDLDCLLSEELQQLLPYGGFACASGELRSVGFAPAWFVARNIPDSYIRAQLDQNGVFVSPIFELWRRDYRPKLYTINDLPRCSTAWLSKFMEHDLRNLAVHGMRDPNGVTVSYFGFCRLTEPLTDGHRLLLDLIIPYLHMALGRIASPDDNGVEHRCTNPLTRRETEILRLVSGGKSNFEIAKVLSISPFTVKNHVQHILGKLEVNNRCHALSKALSIGLL